MTKNEYRRALILLRAARQGMSGHVRLERRTMLGSMQFSLNGLRCAGELQAVMAAKTNAGWKIARIGPLRRSDRGQAGLHWTFDPRCIEGLPLERYAVILVLELCGGECRTLFTGYVNGSTQVDWTRAEEAACAAVTASRALPAQDGAASARQAPAEEPAAEAQADEADGQAVFSQKEETAQLELDSSEREESAQETEADTAQEVSLQETEADLPELNTSAQEVLSREAEVAPSDGDASAQEVSSQETEAALLDIDTTAREASSQPVETAPSDWDTAALEASSQKIEADIVREVLSQEAEAAPSNWDAPAQDVSSREAEAVSSELDAAAQDVSSLEEDGALPDFDTAAQEVLSQEAEAAPSDWGAPACDGAQTALQALGLEPERAWPEGIEPLRAVFAAAEPLRLSALPEHVFIRAWHSAACPECAVGICAREGVPESVAWAIPGEEAPEPPDGLEGYVWKDGWWFAVADADSGRYKVIAAE
ncbi:MAG: hypothetical protein Q4A66_06835 [Eubacteriales bacterium]|nr:hypothetical protein [Eubacteriales bacterium]